MTLPVAILAGGLATRLRPITETIPKSLVEVAGKPFIVRQLALLRRHGISRVVLCVGHLAEQIEAVLGDGRALGLDIAYSHDGPNLVGTGGALRQALPLLGDRFLVLYGDSYLTCDYAAVSRTFLASESLGLMTVFRNDGRFDASNVAYENGRILTYDKTPGRRGLTHIDYGLGALRAKAFDGYPSGAPLDLARVYQDLLARGELLGYEVHERFYEIGSAAGLEDTRRYITSQEES
ncbi:MAG: nucleotidyltransferase family protein [Deltaproteobacteria bacterium]|nr:nucleotidyltransferase family protein [Deltaproteobacteria bacterium]